VKATEPGAPVREELTARLRALLTDEPQRLKDLAEAVRRDPKDRAVRGALALVGVQDPDTKKWTRPGGSGVGVPLEGGTPDTAVFPASDGHAQNGQNGSSSAPLACGHDGPPRPYADGLRCATCRAYVWSKP
jgi:hypothetical protein